MKRAYNIDGNYMVQRIANAAKLTFKENPAADRVSLLESLSMHLAKEVRNSAEYINNVAIVRDNKSWRKSVEIVAPKNDVREKKGYKENRDDKVSDINWSLAFKVFEEFCNKVEEKFSVPCFCMAGAEGDDLLWMLCRRQEHDNIKSLLHYTDSDINTLVNGSTIGFRQIVSKDSPNGEIVVHHNWWKQYQDFVSKQDIFTYDILNESANIALFKNRSIGSGLVAINPYILVFNKCVIGDKKDNIPPLFSWKAKTGTMNRWIGEKHIDKAIQKIRPGFDMLNNFTEGLLYDDAFLQEFIIALFNETGQSCDLGHTLEVFKSNRKLLYLNSKEIPKELQREMVTLINSKFSMQADLVRLMDYNNILAEFDIVRSDSIFAGNLFNTTEETKFNATPGDTTHDYIKDLFSL